ncbi:splicing factor 3B subunit 5 [Angomonas deanei]|uniref:Splicing factor 3B subunit 10 (SF3b10), putative n=1 Tax=Angomonas deanei TaxID=59799 RepID=S9V9I8_9TRYP|nr:splicing factor 3B subunit 5 [Angomonas deanei]EPY43101.1 splicing factor 3B subunit 5 [Angomonas deanei]CAD2216619.1 Splicing factor 3B subunit 10 (SF3b10), putative [Angomonas deanei]|eukprot:EPY39697.1 splicing factor 3B subunit 5 [Angomonas deanei]
MGDPFVRVGLEYQPHIEAVLLKHDGTITVETTKEEWVSCQHRDTANTIIMNRDELMYLSMVENVPMAKMERILAERMVNPLDKNMR